MLIDFTHPTKLLPPTSADGSADYYEETGIPGPGPSNEDYLGNFYANQLVPIDHNSVYTKRLSTISERTERSERTGQSQPWPTHQELLAAHAPRRPPSTPTSSSYGQVIHPSASKFGLASRSGGFGEEDRRSIETTSDFGQVIGEHFTFSRYLRQLTGTECR